LSEGAVRCGFVELVLVSHTNAGKTSLARTLLGQDIGEVRDAPHVTDVAERHVLLRTAAGDELRLWDTPGFGDSARLVQRLQQSDNPIGWLVREVWDRYRDRPLWCTQQAVRAARTSADIVLYLANAAESPRDAGYLHAEAKILQWLGKPVLVLLNQTGPPRPRADEQAEVEVWRAQFAALGLASEVLPLDAFARCWVQEGSLLAAVAARVIREKAPVIERLRAQWTDENVARFGACMRALSNPLAVAAHDSEAIDERAESVGTRVMVRLGLKRDAGARERAMAALAERVDAGAREATAKVIALNGLDAGSTETVLRRVQEQYASRDPIPEGRAALFGGILTGALTGLKADLAAGGLTMGAGALIGGVLGGLGGAGVARGLNRFTGVERASLYWPDDFLDGLLRAEVLRYLAVAHYGRGRGRYVDSEAPSFWFDTVQSEVSARTESLHSIWKGARSGVKVDNTAHLVEQELRALSASVLARLYPDDVSPALSQRLQRPRDPKADDSEPVSIPA